jgi:excisionase family DNA binding protein
MTTPNDTEQPTEPEHQGDDGPDWNNLFAALAAIDAVRFDPYQLLTRDEVAAHLRCTKQYVSELSTAGKLHTVRVGKRVLVPRADLEAFIRGEPPRHTDGRWPVTPSLFDTPSDGDNAAAEPERA